MTVYSTILTNILNSARKKSHSLLPAQTFPTQQKRYGGPLKTSDVEDVKSNNEGSFQQLAQIVF